MLEIGMLDLEEIATALQDQNNWEHCWLIDPQSGKIGFWTEDGGIDGRTPVDLDDLDLVPIEPLPSWVWYRDMADFAERVSDQRASRSLARAIEGKGAFHRFRDLVHHEGLAEQWYAFSADRQLGRARAFLAGEGIRVG